MPTNIEIKARAHDFERQQKHAASLAGVPAERVCQIDTFFNVPMGRMKLRELAPDLGQLIRYSRDELPGLKQSDYLIAVTREPAQLRAVLAAAMGVRGEIRKQRVVYHIGQTRVHFDQVELFGTFIELEVVLKAGQEKRDGEAIAHALMKALSIEASDLVDAAYIDLISERGSKDR